MVELLTGLPCRGAGRISEGQEIAGWTDMKTRVEKTTIKGGWIKRDAASGRLVAVSSGDKVSRASAKTGEVVEAAASRHDAALRRLADR